MKFIENFFKKVTGEAPQQYTPVTSDIWVKTSHGKTGRLLGEKGENTFLVELGGKEYEIEKELVMTLNTIRLKIKDSTKPIYIKASDAKVFIDILRSNKVAFSLV